MDTGKQDLLIKLPCKKGDTVYWIENKGIKSAVARQFGYEDYVFIIADIGKKVVVLSEKMNLYFTKDDAQKALK